MTSTPESTTIRRPVSLPAMPGEHDAARVYAAVVLQRSRIIADRLVFDNSDGFDRALSQGFFLIETPAGLDPTPADMFAQHFHEPRQGDDMLDAFRGYRDIDVPGDYQGYFDREHDQWENFYIEMANWHLVPPGVAKVGNQMTDLGILILRNVFAHLGLPENHWGTVTSGLINKQGHQMLAFNHFRPDKQVRGCKFHRDSGWVTLLRSVEPGLLAVIEDKLVAVNPEPGYLIANFGSSIEVLTDRLPAPVRANVHGVARTQRGPQDPHRWSYVVFLDSDLAGDIYRYQDGKPRPVQSVADFAVQEVSRTYDANNADL